MLTVPAFGTQRRGIQPGLQFTQPASATVEITLTCERCIQFQGGSQAAGES